MNQNQDVRKKWREGASIELEQFLFHRKNELKEGGFMITFAQYFCDNNHKFDEKLLSTFVSEFIKEKLVEFVNINNLEKSNQDKLLVKMYYVEEDDAMKILEKLKIHPFIVENKLVKVLDFFFKSIQ